MRLPGYKPPKVKEEIGADGEPIPAAETISLRQPILPNFGTPFEKITKDAADNQRQRDFEELLSIKEKLAQAGCMTSLKNLERAILMPQELQLKAGEKKYPTPAVGLMVNPHPKKKGKKKGKKKKKR